VNIHPFLRTICECDEWREQGVSIHPFLRTVCECDECRAHCMIHPGPLAPIDVPRLAEHLGISEEQLVDEHLTEGRGATMYNRRTGMTSTVHTLVPRRGDDGSCHWLKDGLCSVHPVAPFGCAYFDAHMSDAEAQSRSVYLHAYLLARDDHYLEMVARAAERKLAEDCNAK